MLVKDNLHIVALALTSGAFFFQILAVSFPHWWILKSRLGFNTLATFRLFGPIRCSETACFPETADSTRLPPDNADWLQAGRVLALLNLFLVIGALLPQAVFLKFNLRNLQLVANAFLISSATTGFITAYLFLAKFTTLTRVYVKSRTPESLSYSSAPPACMLFAAFACSISALFTTIAFRPPNKVAVFSPQPSYVKMDLS